MSFRKNHRIVVKLGGAVLEDLPAFESLCEELAEVQHSGYSITVIHGGGAQINSELRLHGIPWSFHEGIRVTSKAVMEQVEKVLCGQMNKKVVRTFTRFGMNAVGISGLDCQMLACRQLSPELGQVGEIVRVNLALLNLLFANPQEGGNPIIPVIAPVGAGSDGESFNVNADWAAVKVAEAIGAEKILFMTDQSGILDSSGNRISELAPHGIRALMEEGTIRGGMSAKAKAILYALDAGISDVHVLNGKMPGSIRALLLSRLSAGGTRCASLELESCKYA